MNSPVQIRRDDRDVVTVTLDRPGARNALSPELTETLTAVFVELSSDESVRAVVLTGAGGAFCAGGDLQALQSAGEATFQDAYDDGVRFDTLFASVDGCPHPVVAKVEGPALGGGLGLVACADIVVASESASFASPEVRVGIAPAIIAPYVLSKVGPSSARRLMLTGERLGADEALRLGLVHHVTAPADLDAGVEAVIGELLKGNAAAQRAVKRLLPLLARSTDPAARSTLTALETARVRTSEEGRRGLAAVLDAIAARRTSAP